MLIQKIKENYDILWPSFFAIVSCLFVGFLIFIDNYDLDEDTHYLIFFTILIINFVIYWVLFTIQIYIIVKKYFLIERCQLSFAFYLLFFIFYFLFFTFYFLFFTFYSNSDQNFISSGLILIYQTFAVLFLLSFSYEILLFKSREFIFKHIFIALAIISDFVLRYVFSGMLYLNIDSPYYQDNLFLISLVPMLILALSFLITKPPKSH